VKLTRRGVRATSHTILVILSRLAAITAGVVWGFFVAFNVVFSDIFGVQEMLLAILFVIVAYLVLGFLFGALGPKTSWRWTPWLAAPGALFVGSTFFDNPARVVYVLGVLVAVVGATLAGSALGAWARGRLRGRPARPDSAVGSGSGPTAHMA